MSDPPFYKAHWIEIEPERLERYRSMFEWNPASQVLYDAADIQSGHIVADFGCGPGHTAVEIAGWVGEPGHVHALDINRAFIVDTVENARRAGVDERITAHESDGTRLPLADKSIDRVTTRNTLIYVDDPAVTLREFKRVLRTGGKAHAIEGDWPMMIAEPVPNTAWHEFVSAAGYACKTPDIGRKLTSLLATAGFDDIDLQVITRPDMEGRLLPMVRTIAQYARDSGDISGEKIDEILSTLEEALAEKNYLVLAPQFVVTGRR